MFNHHNPLTNENYYNYYVRCVNRFRQLHQYEGHKLFVMIVVNNDNFEENLKTDIIDFNNDDNIYLNNIINISSILKINLIIKTIKNIKNLF